MSQDLRPASLLLTYEDLFDTLPPGHPVLDLACGDGQNGIYLAGKGLPVTLADVSEKALKGARERAEKRELKIDIWRVDLERQEVNPLAGKSFGAILIFRYLHRPLIPFIRQALIKGGLLMYETYTVDQPRFGKPRNPDHLLKPGELWGWFKDWHIIHHLEGIKDHPKRAVAQIVCRKPGGVF